VPAEPESEVPLRLERFLPYRLSVLTNRVSRALARRYRERFGLSIPEWRVMAVLGRQEHLSASELAERTAMDKVKVSRAVAALLGKGLVARARDASDGRISRHRLTHRGREVYQAIARLALELERRWLADLPPTAREELFRMLDRLEAALVPLERELRD